MKEATVASLEMGGGANQLKGLHPEEETKIDMHSIRL